MTKNTHTPDPRQLDRLHVKPTLRFAFSVEGRRTVLTRHAGYAGAVRSAVERRCDCDDTHGLCEYHEALSCRHLPHARHAVINRLAAIYQAEDARRLAALQAPALDLSAMREDQLLDIAVAVEWHLVNGRHLPARKSGGAS